MKRFRARRREVQAASSQVQGGWLTGTEIRKAVEASRITISPFRAEQLNPNSYNYRLGGTLYRLIDTEIDVLAEECYEKMTIDGDGIQLFPGECYLGHTEEILGSPHFASLLTGRSSIGRKFITNHITAGLVDIGFVGQITLEITVQKPTRIYPGIHFGQIYWFSLYGDPLPQYAGKYQSQLGPTPSRFTQDIS